MPPSSPASPDGAHRRKLYGRRKGPKLSAHQESLRATLLPELALALRDGADPRTYFDARVEDVWLEIGFGAGEHLIWQAEQHPQIGMIGAEPYISGIAKLLSKIAPTRTPNIRIHEGDARDVIEALPDASLGRVFILFPDPWPKTRHHKRRFVQSETLDALARVVRPGGELRFASDDPGYFSWALERLCAHPQFTWSATGPRDWNIRAADWPQTRYETKALHGPPRYLRFVRRGQTG